MSPNFADFGWIFTSQSNMNTKNNNISMPKLMADMWEYKEGKETPFHWSKCNPWPIPENSAIWG